MPNGIGGVFSEGSAMIDDATMSNAFTISTRGEGSPVWCMFG
jgi:hypothetical protein